MPPPHDHLPDLLADWERWIHRPDLPLLARVAIGHFQFETLHPYVDGNGRLGRLIVILHLIEEGLMRHHLMTISGYFERTSAPTSITCRQFQKQGISIRGSGTSAMAFVYPQSRP